MRWTVPVLVVAGCGHVDYDAAPAGRFRGSVIVAWVGETQAGLGDGRFVFVPSSDPLVFERGRPGSAPVIRPQMMYTDGGSIPQVAQAFRGLSPWGYAPAYMVHDWLFVARKCLNDGQATEQEKTIESMEFPESAEVAAEAIRTLIAEGRVAPDDVAPRAIASAVAGPISRALWNETGACAAQRIKPEHLRMIRRALPGVGGLRALRDGGPRARIVQVVEF